MKNYLSFGGGVNSVALHLLMIREGFDFESIFINHGTDWPETYEYFEYFQNWLKSNGHKPITELIPNESGFNNLYDFAYSKAMLPCIYPRWCTSNWKIKHINKYVVKPCFMHIGFSSDESKRAKININKGIENRWLLIEHDIDRDGCKKLIESYGLKIPMKSGCYICPFQKKSQFIELRKKHPDLFCKAQQLEQKNIEYRLSKGIKPRSLHPSKKLLSELIEENQMQIFEIDEYPPCQCML